MKVLNLYAGLGGNRKLWKNVVVTAIEINRAIANYYQTFFPKDKVIIVDAHKYLLDHFEEYEFIWSSPPCPSHSIVRKNLAVARGQNKPIYPDMNLYEEVIFLQHHFKGKWVVENVKSYYEPLIKPLEVGKHYFWSNFPISKIQIKDREHNSHIDVLRERKGFKIGSVKTKDKKIVLRNCVEPELGLHVFDCAFNKIQKLLII